ncbi:uncharacterized protein LOC125646412 isoform X2 [Ostrea edulis]|uniref:uncharacterized protein LOC125646412 isoform X2 n=1 Tax=Ostrea edulis TaxID=37623 RepID=UPI0020945C61|nr:uncharacterized protein LOC125646412 isoform X2 [Ostrea edulis]
MVKGSVPMRVRRRQSDAKWRASVASCYDTLKTIIPDNEKMSRRKISKAYILQETEKHIQNLERNLQEILDQKVKLTNKVVLYKTEQGLVEANLTDLRDNFSFKQQELYLQNYVPRKRSRCNVPSDMESGLINLRSSLSDLMVLPAECLNTELLPVDVTQMETDAKPPTTSPPEETISNPTLLEPPTPGNLEAPHQTVGMSQKFGTSANSTVEKLSSNELVLYPSVPGEQHTTGFLRGVDHELPHHYYMTTPIKLPKDSAVPVHQTMTEHFVSPAPGIRTFCGLSMDRTPSTERKSKLPSKKVIRKMQFDSKGLTPVKFDSRGFTPVKFDSRGFTPVKLPEPEDQSVPESPFTLISGKLCDEEEELSLSDLLCTESIEQLDIEDEEDIPQQNQSTPNHRKGRMQQKNREEKCRGRSRSVSEDKRETKQKRCRRQLERSFHEDKKVESACSHDGGSEKANEGYTKNHLLDQNMFSIATDEPPQVWNQMMECEPETYVDVAALLNNQSDASYWSSQVNFSQSQDAQEINQVVPGSSVCNHGNVVSKLLSVQTEDCPYKSKVEHDLGDQGYFTITKDLATDGPYITGAEDSYITGAEESVWESQVVPDFNFLPQQNSQVVPEFKFLPHDDQQILP